MMKFNMGVNDFGQGQKPLFDPRDPNSLASMMNPSPEPDGLGVVPGLGQQPGMQLDLNQGPTQKHGTALDNYASNAKVDAATQGGNGQMAAIMGMDALKNLSGSRRGAGGQGQLSSPAPVAPRGNQIQTQTTSRANPIDPRMFMMMAGGGK